MVYRKIGADELVRLLDFAEERNLDVDIWNPEDTFFELDTPEVGMEDHVWNLWETSKHDLVTC
jgi:hypothetical protein